MFIRSLLSELGGVDVHHECSDGESEISSPYLAAEEFLHEYSDKNKSHYKIEREPVLDLETLVVYTELDNDNDRYEKIYKHVYPVK